METSTSALGYLGQFIEQTDVGSVYEPGSCDYDEDTQTYTITGAGTNIWNDHDDFHFVWKPLAGDFIVTMHAAFVGEGVDPHRKLGWMVRQSLDPSSPMICTAVHGDGLTTLQYRRTQGGLVEEVKVPLSGADVIQLERKGQTYQMSVARYGQPFVTVQKADIGLGEESLVGLFVCSHHAKTTETAVFNNVRVVLPVREGFDRQNDPFRSQLEIMELDTGHRHIVYSEDSVFEAPNWTRDGKELIYNQAGRLYRFDLDHQIVRGHRHGRGP